LQLHSGRIKPAASHIVELYELGKAFEAGATRLSEVIDAYVASLPAPPAAQTPADEMFGRVVRDWMNTQVFPQPPPFKGREASDAEPDQPGPKGTPETEPRGRHKQGLSDSGRELHPNRASG
jgi:hypothetical protein